MSNPIEIIKDRLFWISDRYPPRNKPLSFFVCVDSELQYEAFCEDFGPLNLAMTYRFCYQLDKLLKDPKYINHKIYHYSSVKDEKRANAAYLMGAFQIIILRKSASEAWRPFASQPDFLPFRDASMGPCYYFCTILHCLRGLELAMQLNWFNFHRFDVKFYEFREKVENGDMNWILPGKLLAFGSPTDSPTEENWYSYKPEDFVDLFNNMNVTAVIRLNNKTYEEEKFKAAGIRHYDLFFLDGSCPSDEIVNRFIAIIEDESGAVAVHCKAGLGRTGTLIGCYIIKKYRFPAEDFIAWCRICRPGSILGPQQQFLLDYEKKLNNIENISCYSSDDMKKSVLGDHGQAIRLLSAKRSRCAMTSPGESNRLSSPIVDISKMIQNVERPVTPFNYLLGNRSATPLRDLVSQYN
ncbi:CDC14A_8 [Blepharisma stoltei]|uniref:protein-tyrosine-phosphatase n=1 Tax=Blepharisma stoltei TaxID=1481888 RepID=A0AAU9JE01_9CILI|nr:unnamed protein product [Blepharisma stoltei]